MIRESNVGVYDEGSWMGHLYTNPLSNFRYIATIVQCHMIKACDVQSSTLAQNEKYFHSECMHDIIYA